MTIFNPKKSSNFIKTPIDKDIKHSFDQPSAHEIVTKRVTFITIIHHLLKVNNNYTYYASGNVLVNNPNPYPSNNENPPAHLKKEILNISKNFKTREPANQFMDTLIEGFEMKLPHDNDDIPLALQQEYECWQLHAPSFPPPPIDGF